MSAARSLYVATVVLLAGFWNHAGAGIMTTPADLNVGDQYRLVFITSQVTSTFSTDISVYNAFVDNSANGAGSQLAHLGTNWTAIASAGGVDARDNTNTNPTITTGVPIYLVDGNRVANDYAHLWSGAHLSDPTILVPINRTEIDTVPTGVAQYTGTGTTFDGTQHLAGGLGDASDYRAQGFSNYTIAGWVYSTDHRGHGVQVAMFGISDVLTVQSQAAVPEPSCVGLLLLGLLASGRGKRRSS